MPKSTVVLLSYNQRAYLEQSVNSVLAQTTPDWELLVIDNGSTDGSQQLLEQYRSHPQVRLFLHAGNEACTRRLNQGIQAATGDFISILYSDDYYLPRKLEKQMACFAEHPECGVVYSPGHRLNNSTRAQWLEPTVTCSGMVLDTFLESLEQIAYVNPISPLVRRECFLRYAFHEEIFIEGEAIYLRLAMRYPFHFDPEPVVVMRDHELNLGRSIKRNAGYLDHALQQLEQHADFPAASREKLRNLKIRRYRSYGWQAMRVVDDIPWARENFRHALDMDWRELFHPKVVAGLTMSFLPKPARRAINKLLYAVKRPQGHTNYVAG